MNKKSIASWCLYDFANSIYVAVIPATIWSAYYANRIVGNDAGQGDLWWGRAVSATMLFVAATSPMMGAVADYAGVRKKLLILYTLISAGGTCLLATVSPGMVLWGFAATLLANIGFEGSMVFYNAYLPEIAPADHQGRVSGWGFATGYAGSLLGLLLAWPLVAREYMTALFLGVGAAYLLFAWPAFRWLPPDQPARLTPAQAAGGGLRETWRTFCEILRVPALRRFLLAYFIYEDGVNTVVYFSSIFAATTLGFPLKNLILLFAVVQVSALVGALLWAKPTDRWGPKFVVLAMLAQWSLVVTGVYFVQTQRQFFVVAVLAGTGLGAIQAASRAFMSTLIPRGREAEFFGFYTLCGKSASVLGPLVFGGVSAASGGNQRLAALSVLLFYLVGGVLLWKVKAGGPTVARAAPARA
ncbi:MAG: MFS transporter [Acidobacteria bacterium]|nr:MFS transporter [Acidobacteriota bacterium]